MFPLRQYSENKYLRSKLCGWKMILFSMGTIFFSKELRINQEIGNESSPRVDLYASMGSLSLAMLGSFILEHCLWRFNQPSFVPNRRFLRQVICCEQYEIWQSYVKTVQISWDRCSQKVSVESFFFYMKYCTCSVSQGPQNFLSITRIMTSIGHQLVCF